jgi:predicted aspartyl protease
MQENIFEWHCPILKFMEKRTMSGAFMYAVKCFGTAAFLWIALIGRLTIAGEASKAGDLFLKGDFDAAISEYQSMLKQNPKAENAHLGLIRSFLKKDDIQAAQAAGEKALKLFPANASLYALWGDVLFRRAQTKEATEAYLKAIQLDPKNGRGYLGLAKLHAFNFNRKSVRSATLRAYACDPEDPVILMAYAGNLPLTARIPLMEKYLRLAQNESAGKLNVVRDRIEYAKKWGDRKAWRLVSPPEKGALELTPILPSGRAAVSGYTISALINGRKVELMLDTGAGGVVLHRKPAGKLGLAIVSSTKMKGIGDSGQQQGNLALAKTVKIGPLEFQDCTLGIMDRRPAGADADGIIGLEQFNRYLITLNLPKNKLTLNPLPPIHGKPFNDPESWEDLDRTIPPELASFTRLGIRGHLLTIPVIVNGKKSGFFIVDTGAAANVIDQRFAGQVTNVQSSYVSIGGISGKTKTFVARNISLRLGRFRQNNDGMYAIDLKNMSHDVGMEIDGFLGHPLLSQFALTIDYRDGLIDFDYAYEK